MDLLNALDSTMEIYGLPKLSIIINDNVEIKKLYYKLLSQNNIETTQKDVMPKIFGLQKNRKWHMIVSFALGLYFSTFQNLKERINGYYYSKSKGKIQNAFFKVWSILSILHDVGYDKDEEILTEEKIESIFNIVKIETEKNNVGAKILGFQLFNEHPCTAVFNYNPEDNFSTSRYDKSLYQAYNKWAMERDKINDHGIFGGYFLFTKFLGARAIIDSLTNCKESYNTYLFYDLAYKVLDHNIWKADKTTINDYRKYGLDLLIGDNYKKIDLEDPLLYLLCLTDTIEFVKKGSTINDLQRCLIDVNENIITIGTTNMKSMQNLDAWNNGIKNMEDWMQITVKENDNEILIKS